jgi:hypothetical protein
MCMCWTEVFTNIQSENFMLNCHVIVCLWVESYWKFLSICFHLPEAFQLYFTTLAAVREVFISVTLSCHTGAARLPKN